MIDRNYLITPPIRGALEFVNKIIGLLPCYLLGQCTPSMARSMLPLDTVLRDNPTVQIYCSVLKFVHFMERKKSDTQIIIKKNKNHDRRMP